MFFINSYFFVMLFTKNEKLIKEKTLFTLILIQQDLIRKVKQK